MTNQTSNPVRETLVGLALPALLGMGGRGRHAPDAIVRAQESILEGLVEQLGSIPWSHRTGLSALRELRGAGLVDGFRRTVPTYRYSDLEVPLSRIVRGEEDVLFPGRTVALAQTSGTTSASGAGERYVPQNSALLAHHARGALASLRRLCAGGGGGALRGRLLMLGGSTALVRNKWGVPVGDLSGITVDRIPWYLRGLYEPGHEIALEPDWTRKLDRIAERLAHADVTLVSGVPSWCLVLFDAVCRRRGVSSIRDVWPRLRGFVHGGASIDPYLAALRSHLPEDCLLQEAYPSSEAFVAIGSRPWKTSEDRAPDLELLWNHGVFLEFLPAGTEDGSQAVGPEGLERGRIYRILVTTPGGLVRYEIGDLVEGRGPGSVRFAGRIKTRISVFGEHVEGAKLAEAMAHACAKTDSVCREFHVAPILPGDPDPRGAHEWWVEFAAPPPDPSVFALELDLFLRREVLDYDAHRQDNVQLLAPRLRTVPEGTFHRTLATMGKLGGQHKIPIAWPDRTWADRLQRNIQGDAP